MQSSKAAAATSAAAHSRDTPTRSVITCANQPIPSENPITRDATTAASSSRSTSSRRAAAPSVSRRGDSRSRSIQPP